MKVDLLVLDENDNQQWIDFYLDDEIIKGFYIPIKTEEDLMEDSVNVRVDNEFMTFKLTEQLINYLTLKFVNK